jgi:hypothetical protein
LLEDKIRIIDRIQEILTDVEQPQYIDTVVKNTRDYVAVLIGPDLWERIQQEHTNKTPTDIF